VLGCAARAAGIDPEDAALVAAYLAAYLARDRPPPSGCWHSTRSRSPPSPSLWPQPSSRSPGRQPTSRTGVGGLEAAQDGGRHADLIRSLQDEVLAAAVGTVTAQPLRDAGIEPLIPDRHRLGALVRAVADHLAQERVRDVALETGMLQLRGQAATLDGRPLTLSPAPMAMLRTLAHRPGDVVDRQRLLAVLPGATDLHAVEMAVGRLRAGLGRPGVVETVVKRGYRLALAPAVTTTADRPPSH
jgi:DNA-binding winged helix-turn-helix (wHTH) protein